MWKENQKMVNKDVENATFVRARVIILNLCPIVYLWFVLGLLDKVTLSGFVPFWEDANALFVNSLFQLFVIGAIFWATLGVFGFYRIYHAIAVKYWKTLFCDIAKKRFVFKSCQKQNYSNWQNVKRFPAPFQKNRQKATLLKGFRSLLECWKMTTGKVIGSWVLGVNALGAKHV